MTARQIALVKSSWTLVSAIDPEIVGSLFYNRLFEIAPEIRPLFHRRMPEQSKKFLAILGHVIDKLDALDDILENIVKLATRHEGYGVKPEHYAMLGEALLWTLEKGLGEQWDEDLKEAWTMCYVTLSSIMLNVTKYVRLRR